MFTHLLVLVPLDWRDKRDNPRETERVMIWETRRSRESEILRGSRRQTERLTKPTCKTTVHGDGKGEDEEHDGEGEEEQEERKRVVPDSKAAAA